jgi:hypothetical protein
MVQITDGRTGKVAEVSSENRLKTSGITEPIDLHMNEFHQRMFSVTFDAIDPVGADDYFFYTKNTGTKNLHIIDITMLSTVAGSYEIHAVSGTPTFTAGTDLTPVNRNIGNSNTLNATIKSDTNTTGLTNDGILFYERLDTANKQDRFVPDSHIIIPPGQAVAFLWDTSTGALTGTIGMYEQQGDV